MCRFVGKKLETRAALPGLKVEYSTDDGVTWNDVTSQTEVDEKVKLRTRYGSFILLYGLASHPGGTGGGYS